MQLPGSAAIPAPYRDRQEMAYRTGLRIVDMVREDLKPSDILTARGLHQRHPRQFRDRRLDQCADPSERARPPHRRRAVHRRLADLRPRHARCWSTCSRPANIWARITTVPAACRRWSAQLMGQGLIHEDALTVNGRTDRRELPRRGDRGRERDPPLRQAAEGATPASCVLRGNLFDFGDHEDQRDLRRVPRALSVRTPTIRKPSKAAPWCSTGRRIITRASTIRRSAIDERRSCSCAAPARSAIRARPKWSTCAPPAYLIREGITSLPCIGDGRQSGTSGSPSILNASPEAAAGGGLALLRTGDRVRIDLKRGTADMLVSDAETGRTPPRAGRRRAAIAYPGASDAVAGNPARPGRPAGNRRGAGSRPSTTSASPRPRACRATTTEDS